LADSIFLEAALRWAEAGFHVFAVQEGNKKPLPESGAWKDATTDPEKIRAMWLNNPNRNVACAPALNGCTVLDVDLPLGEATLNAIADAENDPVPMTFAIRTPSGGRHLWFHGVCPTSVGTDKAGLGPKLDTRGTGGYVLLPPSQIGGVEYVEENENEIAALPEWCLRRLTRSTDIRRSTEGATLDEPQNVARAIAQIKGMGKIRQRGFDADGGGADASTYIAFCKTRDQNISEGLALDLVKEHLDILPRDERFEAFLERKRDSAYRYGQNEAGAWATRSGRDAFASYAGTTERNDRTDDKSAEGTEPRRFHFRNISEQKNRKPTQWLKEEMIPREAIGFMYGDSESFKTFLALDLCLGLSAGIETFGTTNPERMETAYIAGEGPAEIETKRRPAWQMARNVADDIPFYTIDEMPCASLNETIDEFIDTAKEEKRRPVLVVIDTAFWFGGGLDLNNGKDVGIVMAQTRKIRKELSCSVLLIHHIGKREELGMSGSRHLFGAVEFVIEVHRHPGSLYVSAVMRKQKDAEKRKSAWNFAGHKVGDSLVFSPVTATEFAEATEERHVADRKNIAAALRKLGAIAPTMVTDAVLIAELCNGTGHSEADVGKLLRKEVKAGGDIEALFDGIPRAWSIPSEA
jgi:hypothetical protein